ncbi:hypothetical protein [Ruminococcus flavefaciens]|uniref:hypothetical protein n=1 Tax=Ruminococcus flavefaciens TaxID=1265 RepID=UPI000491F048|nr:hypothetical protein [Ruminococcus flavefaciens]
MNSKKKIIETLKKADKASVERLLEEQARKEAVYARVQKKETADHNDYTDVAEGVEKYERKINMTRIISMAAAIMVMLGAIGGGAYLRRNKGPKTPDDVLTATTTTSVPTTEAVATAPVTTVTGKNGSVVTVTSAAASGSAATAPDSSTTTTTTAAVTEKENEKPAVTTAPQSSYTKTEEKVLAEIRQYSQFGEEAEKVYREYARIIDECCTMIKGGDMTDAKYDSDLSREFISASHEDPAHIGYAFYDIDEDGVNELLLGVNYDYGEENKYFDSVIYNIFGADSNGEVKCIVSGALRDRYYICTNPTADRPMNGMQHGSFIMNAGSGGASHSVNYFYRLAYDKLRYVEGVVTDGLDDNNEPLTYYSATKEYDTSNEARISNDEANKIIDSYNIVDFRFTALD